MTALPWIAGALTALGAFFLLRRPLHALLRLLVRSSVGLAALALFSQIGHLAGGVTLGVNVVNALVLGALGAPGFALLLMVQWVLR